jgi:hypothetical protein
LFHHRPAAGFRIIAEGGIRSRLYVNIPGPGLIDWSNFDAELTRARQLVKIKAASDRAEVTEQALRAAEIDVCKRMLDRIRTAQERSKAIKAAARPKWRACLTECYGDEP